MNPRLTTVVVGTIILALGLAGLLYPDRVLGFLGLAVLDSTRAAAALGEIRATYGGIFAVMGIYTLLAAFDPPAHRARLLFVGLMWLGACGGRLVGVYLNGNPGLPGWLAAAFELAIGGALVVTSQAAGARVEPAAPVAAAGAQVSAG